LSAIQTKGVLGIGGANPGEDDEPRSDFADRFTGDANFGS